MGQLPSGSVDMILCDLPYGITDCRWDSLIPFPALWEQYERVIKPNGAIVLTAAQPFTTDLINSNRKSFRYVWYWRKNMPTGFPFAKFQPLRCVEEICVFYKRMPTYNPQGIVPISNPKLRKKILTVDSIYKQSSLNKPYKPTHTNYPRHILDIKCERGLHPTQKPVELFEYLIRTYTNPGEIVLDNCMGSGTTAVACINTRRKYIGYELDSDHYSTAIGRVKKAKEDKNANERAEDSQQSAEELPRNQV